MCAHIYFDLWFVRCIVFVFMISHSKYYSLDSEGDFRLGCQSVSHQQQFFSELPSPGRSHYTISSDYFVYGLKTVPCNKVAKHCCIHDQQEVRHPTMARFIPYWAELCEDSPHLISPLLVSDYHIQIFLSVHLGKLKAKMSTLVFFSLLLWRCTSHSRFVIWLGK